MALKGLDTLSAITGGFKKLARSWRDDGNYCTLTSITVMAATPIFIG